MHWGHFKYIFYQYKRQKIEGLKMSLKKGGGGQTEGRGCRQKRDLFGSGSRSGLIGQDYQ